MVPILKVHQCQCLSLSLSSAEALPAQDQPGVQPDCDGGARAQPDVLVGGRLAAAAGVLVRPRAAQHAARGQPHQGQEQGRANQVSLMPYYGVTLVVCHLGFVDTLLNHSAI